MIFSLRFGGELLLGAVSYIMIKRSQEVRFVQGMNMVTPMAMTNLLVHPWSKIRLMECEFVVQEMVLHLTKFRWIWISKLEALALMGTLIVEQMALYLHQVTLFAWQNNKFKMEIVRL